jgi:tight adherence protein B
MTYIVFAAAFLAVIALYSLLRDVAEGDPRRIKKRVEEELGRGSSAASQKLFKNLSELAPDPFADEEQQAASTVNRLHQLLEQSGLSVTPVRIFMRSLLTGLVLGGFAWLASGSPWFAVLPFTLGLLIPAGYVLFKRNQRLEQLRKQLPDAFSLMARVLRAGQTSAHAMEIVSHEFQDPLSGEFSYCQEQQNLGLPADIALRDLARRTGLLEIKLFVVASMVHREAGGNLADLLENLSTVIRERFRVRGVVRSLTAEGRFQAAVLLALPLVLFGAISALNREYLTILWNYPWLLVGALCSELLGALWLRKIVNFDY